MVRQMMKYVTLILILVAAVLAYDHFKNKPVSGDMKMVLELEADFAADQDAYLESRSRQREQDPWVRGDELQDIIGGIEQTKMKLQRLIPRLTEEGAMKKALWLDQKIKRFIREMGYK